MFQRVLVPLDGSRFSGRALPYAIEIAKRFGGEVILMQVVRPVPFPIMPASGEMLSPTANEIMMKTRAAQEKTNLAWASRYLKRKLKLVAANGVAGTHRAESGDPAKAIIKFCQKESVDLVVMTTSGKSGIRRAFLGSVADKIIRESGVPVLAIRPERRPGKK